MGSCIQWTCLQPPLESTQSCCKWKNPSHRILTNNSIFQGKDDETGEPLTQRDDDKPEVIRSRLDTYDKNTNPIADFYK